MSREAKIKLYKKIRSKYYNYGLGFPDDEKREAIEAGYLLEGLELFASHNEAIKKAKERAALINKSEVADAFLYSLSTSLCEYRSPLLSFYYIQSITPHEYDGYYEAFCNICGYYNGKNRIITEPATSTMPGYTFSNFNAATFALVSKYLSGTVYAYYVDYCIMDITEYLTMPKVTASARDKDIFIDALNLINTLSPSDTAGTYVNRLYESKIIPNSTKIQVSSFVDTLGDLNILHKAGDYAITKGREMYDNSYRDPVPSRTNRRFPITHWRASDGVDWDEARAIFNIKG